MNQNALKDLQNVNQEVINIDSGYAGIPIYAWPNLHVRCFEEIESFKLSKDSKILILWAGGGAFDQRLVDNGYTNITAVELIPEAYKASGTTLIPRDLNQNFTDLGKFDCVIALEIIEHLENPFSFLRNIRECLLDDGFLLLSTPNVENFYSRAHFFLFSTLDYFGPVDLHGTGHISPMFHHIFSFFAEKSGFTILKRTYNQSAVYRGAFIPNLFAVVSYIFLFILRRETNSGAINIYTLQPTDI